MGMNYGSLHNHLYSRQTIGQPEPEVGMGATILFYSDRQACTIVNVGKINNTIYIDVQKDLAKRTDNNGMSDCQSYEYSPNPDGSIRTFRFNNKTQKWECCYKNPETGRWNVSKGEGLKIGVREEYYDFSF